MLSISRNGPAWWLMIAILFLPPHHAQSADYAVRQDGSGAFTTIQACASAVQPGDTCSVYPGLYDEHVKTVSGGSGDTNRVTFKAIGAVTMRGFDISHAWVTVAGFDITGYEVQYSGQITVYAGGSNCELLNNSLRDGAANVYGIYFYLSRGQAANHCVVRGNTLSNLSGHLLTINGNSHLFEHNILEYNNNMDYVRLFGANHVLRRNIFRRGVSTWQTGNHPDFIQTWGDEAGRSQDHLLEENWIENLQAQFAQLNSGDGVVTKGRVYSNVQNIVFRRNVISNVSDNGNIGVPGTRFENNTFYMLSHELSGLIFSGSLTRGDASRGTLENNVFLAGGAKSALPNDFSGFYSVDGAFLSREVISVFVTREKDASGYIIQGPICLALYEQLKSSGYIDSNGKPLAKARALADVSDLVLSTDDAAQRDALYEVLVRTVQLDDSIRSTFSADYNFVAGSDVGGFPAKRHNACKTPGNYTDYNFCEAHGINGGDPKLANFANPLGPDGIPFTLDDGLKPLPGSPLCGSGRGGRDIGAYSCDPEKVLISVEPPDVP